MTLFDILLFLFIVLIIVQFWRIRSISEYAKNHLEDYCEQQDLQLISVARRKTRLTSVYGKIDFGCTFEFEFSGNGEDSYTGVLKLKGTKVIATQISPYRVN